MATDMLLKGKCYFIKTYIQFYTKFLILFVILLSISILSQDIGDVYARLFDHRPVIQGEINFTLHEFEASILK